MSNEILWSENGITVSGGYGQVSETESDCHIEIECSDEYKRAYFERGGIVPFAKAILAGKKGTFKITEKEVQSDGKVVREYVKMKAKLGDSIDITVMDYNGEPYFEFSVPPQDVWRFASDIRAYMTWTCHKCKKHFDTAPHSDGQGHHYCDDCIKGITSEMNDEDKIDVRSSLIRGIIQ